MSRICVALSAVTLLVGTTLYAQNAEPKVVGQLKALIAAQPADRPAATLSTASEIRALPVGLFKVQCADALAQISMRDDPGAEAMDVVAATLDEALTGFPLSTHGDHPAGPYMNLARLVRYEHAKAVLDDPSFAQAMKLLSASDRHVEASDFALKDLQGRSHTLSQLRGKVVLVNFWASWCAPCLVEMPDLDNLYAQLKAQGLVVLAISNEEEAKVRTAVARMGFHAPVLLDPGSVVGHRFGLEGVPRTFVFNRAGKLVAVGPDQRSRRQLIQMLAAAGLHP